MNACEMIVRKKSEEEKEKITRIWKGINGLHIGVGA